MTTIGAWRSAALAGRSAGATYRSLKGDLGNLQLQLSSGQAASTYSGIAPGALTSLSARSVLSSLKASGTAVDDGTLRANLLALGLGQIDTVATKARTTLPDSYQASLVEGTTATLLSGFQQVVDILNTQVGDRYLFSGRAAATAPVPSADVLLDGAGSRAGLKQLVAERQEADRGANGLGRLAVTGRGTSTTIVEEAAGLPFGLKIKSVATTGSGLAATTTAGPPAAAALNVSSQPDVGSTAAITFGLPDGTEATVSLTALEAGSTPLTSNDGSSGSFAVGRSAADTAANLQAALTTALGSLTTTTLSSASAAKASSDFFAGTTANPPARVDGPPFDTATGTRPGTGDDTVVFYAGEDGADPARDTAIVQTGQGSVSLGFRANEAGFRSILAGLGAFLADGFPASDPTASARFTAAASRLRSNAQAAGVQDAEADVANAQASLTTATDRITTATKYAEDTVQGVEGADPTKVATELLDVQTRLQASYGTTAAIAKMSLVNYL